MIKLNTIPIHTNDLIINGNDYNGNTPQDWERYFIEENIDFIENEEQAFNELIQHEPRI